MCKPVGLWMEKDIVGYIAVELANPTAASDFPDLLSEIERISDICSNIGVAAVARVQSEMKHQAHGYYFRLLRE